jgi:signal transduction histidine kinase
LAAGVAHELRNPLGIINTSLYYINDVLKPRQSDIQKHVKIIEEEIARSRKIIENLLEFSRRSDYEAEEVNVNNLLQTIFALLEKDFLVNDINLELHFGQLPCLYLNLDALKQAFLNIILNATQAMPNGGRLTVITRCVPAPSKSDPDGKGPIEQDFVKISFQDTGLGIPKESINNIFDPFFTTKEPGKGTGLGLTITYSVIKRCGGDIEVESGEGKGTKVTVILPIRKD